MSEEREIDLIDLTVEVLKHWKGIIVSLIIGAICLGAYSYMNPQGKKGEELTFAEGKAVDVVLEYEELYIQAKEQENVEMIIELSKAVLDGIKTFSDPQIDYFMKNSNSDLWGKETLGGISIEANNQLIKKKVSIKLIIIGAIVFGFVYMLIWMLKYLFDGKVKSSDNMVDLIGISQLGKFWTSKAPSFIVDRMLYNLKHHGQRVFEEEKSIELAAANISVNAEKKNVKSITIIGTDLQVRAMKYCEKLEKVLRENYKLEANILEDIVYNQKALESLVHSQSVVIVETVGNTSYSDLDDEVKLVKQLGILIIGGVIID